MQGEMEMHGFERCKVSELLVQVWQVRCDGVLHCLSPHQSPYIVSIYIYIAHIQYIVYRAGFHILF